MYDEHGRLKTETGLSEPARRTYGKWLAIAAGILIFVPSVFITFAGIMWLVIGSSGITGFGFYIFALSWWVLFFGIGGLVGAISAFRRTHGLLAVVGTVLMMFAVPYLAAPALLLLYFAKDEFL
ncbi:MAG: hypothetical protein ACE5QW_00450 [Thermoplasmata archaeon]